MSWDIFVSNFPADAHSANDIPDHFVARPVGSRREIIARIREIIPSAIFPDRSWGTIQGPELDVEIRLGDNENVTDFAFHIRGSEASAACVAEILRHLKLRALDSGTGEFFDLNRPADGLQKWQAYRDQILSQKGKIV